MSCLSRAGAPAIMLLALCGAASAEDVNVYTYREPGLIKPLFEEFSKETGIKVNIIFAKEGLEERIAAEGTRSPADVLITTDVARLVRAVELGITRPVQSAVINAAVPAELRDKNDQWFGLSYRARVIYASKDRVKENELTYENLADPKWKGRVCIRDGQHIYNNMLFAAGVVHMGEAKAESWISGIKANLAKKPSGGDREVAKDIAADQCDIGLGNTYYVGLMLNKVPEQKPWAEAIKVILPTFAGHGTHVNLSGMAILKNAPNPAGALKLGEWLVGATAQKMYTSENYEFPVRKDVPIDPAVANFGKLTPDALPFDQIIGARRKAADIVDRVGFNGGPG